MKKEFNELVSTLKRWDLYHKGDEVYIALTELEKKIAEVEKRIDCAMRSNQDSNSIVMQFVDGFQDEGLVKQTLNHIDFETLQRGIYDVDVALNMNDTECIDNNWYELFEPKEEFIAFESSWGQISCDKDGNVISIDGEEEIRGERNYLFDIAKFDLVEYGKFCESKNIVMGEYGDDILAVGFWKKDGSYEKADVDWRKNIFGEEEEEEDAPTQLCIDPTKHEIVNNIISQLKGIEVDGETMEYILKQVGMDYQVLMQLFAQTTNDEIDYLHDVRNGKG